jgi:hypothetical protein
MLVVHSWKRRRASASAETAETSSSIEGPHQEVARRTLSTVPHEALARGPVWLVASFSGRCYHRGPSAHIEMLPRQPSLTLFTWSGGDRVFGNWRYDKETGAPIGRVIDPYWTEAVDEPGTGAVEALVLKTDDGDIVRVPTRKINYYEAVDILQPPRDSRWRNIAAGATITLVWLDVFDFD